VYKAAGFPEKSHSFTKLNMKFTLVVALAVAAQAAPSPKSSKTYGAKTYDTKTYDTKKHDKYGGGYDSPKTVVKADNTKKHYYTPASPETEVKADEEAAPETTYAETKVESEEETAPETTYAETEVESEEETAPETLTPEMTYAPETYEKPEGEVKAEHIGRPARECKGEIMTIVEEGDNLWDLAKEYNKDFEKLLAANGHLGPNFDLIFPKDEVCVPEGCGEFTGPEESPYGNGETEEDDDEEDADEDEEEETDDSTTDTEAGDGEFEFDETDSIAELKSSASSVTASLLMGVATLFVYIM
jgi:hypothetical protein